MQVSLPLPCFSHQLFTCMELKISENAFGTLSTEIPVACAREFCFAFVLHSVSRKLSLIFVLLPSCSAFTGKVLISAYSILSLNISAFVNLDIADFKTCLKSSHN